MSRTSLAEVITMVHNDFDADDVEDCGKYEKSKLAVELKTDAVTHSPSSYTIQHKSSHNNHLAQKGNCKCLLCKRLLLSNILAMLSQSGVDSSHI